jgi:hypothetical protein
MLRHVIHAGGARLGIRKGRRQNQESKPNMQERELAGRFMPSSVQRPRRILKLCLSSATQPPLPKE